MNKTILFALLLIQTLIKAQFSERNLSSEKWQFKNSKENKWLTASVPGTVHLDLMNNKLIPDPYKDENEKKVQWVENEDWDYQTVFKISAKELENQNADLVFHGLDTFSEIYLNGKRLKKTDNMFRTWKIPVKNDLKIGNNILQIKFKSSVNIGKDLAKKVPFTMPESPRSFVRKAQYQFGWDWGPRLVTAGIWKYVKLNFWNQAKIENIKIEHKALTKQRADLNIYAEIFAEQSGKYSFLINNETRDVSLQEGSNKISIPFQITNPKLWQPNGWGEPTLYDLKVSLKKDSKTLSFKSERIGLRTIELVQEKDEKGKSFYFKVNGNPMYAKGTNWIPSDSFTQRITKEKYKKLIQDCKDANMNMIRVWGGGIYEDDEFYKACDENGILVWQDFMFAGSFYPSDEDFLKNVKEEVKDQVNRLQNHPSIALWCGNNEIDEAIVNWGYQKQFKYSKEDSLQVWKDYKKVFHEVIPNALKENLTSEKNIYWPTSPSIGWGHKESLTEGDSHYWGVWWGEFPFEIYNEKVPRFASEYGFQGMPSLETVKSMFSVKSDLSLENPTIKAHEKNARGFEIIQKYMERDYVIPKDFVKYNYVSQLLQARGMQIAIEAHRRAKPYNMGTLYWQLNDCWPVISWSSIDYLGNWKALHYQVKRSFENQVILTEEKEEFLDFYGINDELKNFEDVKVEIQVVDFNGKILNDLTTVQDGKILDGIVKFNHIEIKNLIKYSNKNEVFLKLILKDKTKKIIAQNNHFFVKPKDLKLTKPNIKIKKISATEIEISTDILAKDVYLMGDTHFSDNFFDLLPKTSKKVTLSKSLKSVEVMTLWDTMNE
ncbi:beta-mannosidase [Chryseobacterium balustinum]|uniref:Beta-mannosidase n=1 Tax=Chryseobacterium balustinum TaxID=246 RepID=A0AAX2IPH9_9FLAO|nr:glycoside hydrolase family 2 protein [Chryseobacterium balustinum]AZB30044.1 glycoside hydrolase family 2 protein [Chryseobacterium balustinum]SKB66797.1 beta-mannosidase [Chryseobacterium balustinum]SQA91742.1 Exo-beta-D-glucosaminidase precursor [Chryseobacterium balustinum]